MSIRLLFCAVLVAACCLLPMTGCETPPGPSDSGTTGAAE
jgi:hypothetical protein